MIHILVTGANGQLGNELRQLAAEHADLNFYFTDVAELDICDEDAVAAYLCDKPLDLIINCAAYTAVDKAEADVDLCGRINSDAVGVLGRAAAARNARMIQVSTDYVYSGEGHKPYTEDELTVPVSVYGITKLAGEHLLAEVCPDSVILRTSWLYSEFGNNFVKTMIRLGKERQTLGVIFDQIGTPTYAGDLAETILKIAESGAKWSPGVYNYSNEGVCSWYDFAVKVHELAGIRSCKVSPLETVDYPTPAKRPFYSVMNKKKIKQTYGVEIPHWEQSLRRCISKMLVDK